VNQTKMPQDHCPYWDQTNKQDCKLTKGGLYIPLPEHIEIFCRSSHFSQCHQYIRGCELLDESTVHSIYYDDSRRKHRRIKDRLPISFTFCDPSGIPVNNTIEEAMSVDLSVGGMCFEINRKIPDNELLLLNISEKNGEQNISGLAEVKWCDANSGLPGYLVGVAFKTRETTERIGQHLGVSVL
jgi:hypothetical protein